MSDHQSRRGLTIPKRISALINSGYWPKTEREIRTTADLKVLKERLQAFAPEHDRIDFAVPPFRTIAERMGGRERKFWLTWGALNEIDPDLTLLIAYFEHGSDCSIALDYRENRENPSVIRLVWRKPQPNTWVRVSENFDQFADMLGLHDGSLPESG